MIVTRIEHQGFSLVELMITLTVLAIVVGIGLPSFRDSIDRNNIISEANRLVASINFARSQAVAKGQVVTLANTSTIANNWSQGWTVFSDFNTDKTNGSGYSPFVDKEDTLLKSFEPNTAQLNIRTNTPAENYISFNRNGRIIANAGGGAIVMSICDANITSAVPGRRIIISPVGRTTVRPINAADKAAQCTP